MIGFTDPLAVRIACGVLCNGLVGGGWTLEGAKYVVEHGARKGTLHRLAGSESSEALDLAEQLEA